MYFKLLKKAEESWSVACDYASCTRAHHESRGRQETYGLYRRPPPGLVVKLNELFRKL
jgi:hypothetical protein